MKFNFAVVVLPLLLTGCFQASPGGIEGAWRVREDFEAPTYTVTRTIALTFNGDRVVRTLTEEARSATTNDRRALREVASGDFTVDTSFSPPRIDITNITRDEEPSDLDYAIYGAITGNDASRVELFFGESTALTFQPKGLYQRNGDALSIKFGSDIAYPISLDAPFLYVLDKQFRLFP
jgi:hypothetical protein